MNRVLKWFYILSKRLYKKWSFLMLLALIPLSVILLSFSAGSQSGFLNIALTYENKDDKKAQEIVNDLKDSSLLVSFTVCEEKEDALNLIKTGKVDAVWIFPDDMEQKIDLFVENKSEDSAVVRVIEREESTMLYLVREKLVGSLYKHCATAQYIHFARTELPELDNFSDEYLLNYYNEYEMIGELFSYNTPYSNANAVSVNYVLTPIRGILGILLCLATIAAALYFSVEEQYGTYSLLTENRRRLVSFASKIVTALNLTPIILLCIYLTGVNVSVLKEIICLALFILAASAFATLFASLITKQKILAAVSPFLILFMAVASPVFMDLKETKLLSYLFPTTYYLKALYNNKYILYTALYAAVCMLLYFVVLKLKEKFKKV